MATEEEIRDWGAQFWAKYGIKRGWAKKEEYKDLISDYHAMMSRRDFADESSAEDHDTGDLDA